MVLFHYAFRLLPFSFLLSPFSLHSIPRQGEVVARPTTLVFPLWFLFFFLILQQISLQTVTMWSAKMLLAITALLASVVTASPQAVTNAPIADSMGSASCKCFPGDACWPTKCEWDAFNATIGGRLVATTPLGSVCYPQSKDYDAKACSYVKAHWPIPETHIVSSSSPMSEWFTNNSYNPFADPLAFGDGRSYVSYAVNATGGADDYIKTLRFATKHNIRLVVRSTGHDYFGKSTGAGALALWTHYLQDISIIDNYTSRDYNGPSLKVGAGVQIRDAYAFTEKAGLAVAGGNCDTVGLAGGYSQGGGLGPMTPFVGLAADQVLEWEVVTATGQHLIVTPYENSELFWALSGGGGGTYAAVLSMTVRAYPTFPVTGATMALSYKSVDEDTWNDILKVFLRNLPKWTEKGVWASFLVIPDTFLLNPAFAPNLSKDDMQSLLQPFLQALDDNNVPYSRFSSFATSNIIN